jgi:hypothetical protein
MPHIETPQSRCRLGIARCDITPPVGIYHRLWGAATHERAAGIHRSLTATAVVFQAIGDNGRPTGDSAADDAEQILIAVDHCLLWAREMESLLAAVARQAQSGRGPRRVSHARLGAHRHQAQNASAVN